MKGYNKDMGKLGKLLIKLQNENISVIECYSMLQKLGYIQNSKGKTSGSAIKFEHPYLPPLYLHKAHNGRDKIHHYECKAIKDALRKGGIL